MPFFKTFHRVLPLLDLLADDCGGFVVIQLASRAVLLDGGVFERRLEHSHHRQPVRVARLHGVLQIGINAFLKSHSGRKVVQSARHANSFPPEVPYSAECLKSTSRRCAKLGSSKNAGTLKPSLKKSVQLGIALTSSSSSFSKPMNHCGKSRSDAGPVISVRTHLWRGSTQ